MSPGSLVHIGNIIDAESRISVIDYSKETIEEQSIQSTDELLQFIDKNTVTWLNVEGLKDVELVESIGGILNIHPLVLEDILNTYQRPIIYQVSLKSWKHLKRNLWLQIRIYPWMKLFYWLDLPKLPD